MNILDCKLMIYAIKTLVSPMMTLFVREKFWRHMFTCVTSFLKLTMRNQCPRRGKSSSSALRSSKATLHLQDSWRLKYFTNFPWEQRKTKNSDLTVTSPVSVHLIFAVEQHDKEASQHKYEQRRDEHYGVGQKTSKWGRPWGVSSDSQTTEPPLFTPQDHWLSSIWTLKLLVIKKKIW